jgi:hypothetical protein
LKLRRITRSDVAYQANYAKALLKEIEPFLSSGIEDFEIVS